MKQSMTEEEVLKYYLHSNKEQPFNRGRLNDDAILLIFQLEKNQSLGLYPNRMRSF